MLHMEEQFTVPQAHHFLNPLEPFKITKTSSVMEEKTQRRK